MKKTFLLTITLLIATVFLSSKAITPDATVNITNRSIAVSIGNFSIAPLSSSVDTTAGSVNLTLTSNLDWSATSNDDWLIVSSASGNSDASVSVSYEANPATSSRSGSVTFSASGIDDVVVSFEQTGLSTGINSKNWTKHVSLSPNPATSRITLSCEQILSNNTKIELYDIEGQLIETFPFKTGTKVINIKDYENGYYFVKIISGDVKTVKRFVKK